MSKTFIWHNPRCSKSRDALGYLKERGVAAEVFDYLNEPIDPKSLAKMIRDSRLPLADFVRANEPEFKELGLKLAALTPESFAEIAAKYPRLLQRPIIIHEGKVTIGRSIEHEEAGDQGPQLGCCRLRVPEEGVRRQHARRGRSAGGLRHPRSP